MVKTFVVGGTASTHAIACITFDVLPHAAPWKLRQCRERTVVGVVSPVLHEIERVLLFFVVTDARLFFAGNAQTTQRHVVAATFAQHGGELIRYHRLEQRHVFFEDLFLQRDGVSAHDDTLATLENAANCRDQIGKTLTHARARFDHESSLVGEVRFDSLGHAQLLGPCFKSTHAARERTLRAQEISRQQRQGAQRVTAACGGFADMHTSWRLRGQAHGGFADMHTSALDQSKGGFADRHTSALDQSKDHSKQTRSRV